MPKISIITPVYKVEKYLRKCIDSILAQTFTDFELILVDDGSPDNCPVICDEYAAKDLRIKVIHKKNDGVYTARNDGLDAAQGDYIGFVDSDDWINPNMYEVLYQNIIKHHVEISACSAIQHKLSGESILFGRPFEKSGIYTKEYFDSLSYIPLIGMWACLFDKKFLTRENIRNNPLLRRSGDAVFKFRCFLRFSKLYFHDEPLYHYMELSDSITRTQGFSVTTMSAVVANKIMIELEPIKKRMPFHLHRLSSRYIDILLGGKQPVITNALWDLMYQYYSKESVEKLIANPTISNVVKFIKKSLRTDCWKILCCSGHLKGKMKFLACFIRVEGLIPSARSRVRALGRS